MLVSVAVVQPFKRALGLFDATMIVIGGIIGSGIFINPDTVAQRLDSSELVIGAWVAGGVIALIGALAYAELGAIDATLQSAAPGSEGSLAAFGAALMAGTTAFPRVRGVKDTTALVETLIRDYDTVVVPGHFFQAPEHIRISFGGQPEKFSAALAQLDRGLHAILGDKTPK